MGLRFEQRGSGRDVVMLHGLPSTPASMWNVGDALVDVARVTNVHLPGYEGSPPLRPFVEAEAMDLVLEALRAAHVRRPVLLGYSGGSYRALSLALRPEVEACGLVALGAMPFVSADHGASLRASAAVVREAPADLTARFAPAFLSPKGLGNAAFVAEVDAWLHAMEPADLAAELEAFSRVPPLDLRTLAMPVLARVGDADLATPVALTDALVAAVPHAIRQVVPGAGHAIMLEDREATAAAVRAFVRSVRAT
ncbi:MAG: alpha/beta hydrolase fold protein [Labilithrix sp.]|nr:alpha/beta hydrolase fold protein [Labilithrix sp.]